MFDLLLITDPAAPLGIAGSVRAALAGVPPGRVAVQLRAKALGAAALLAIARELRAITRDCGCALLINDRLDLAQLVGADGVHLPEAGLPPAAVRGALGPDAWIGVSCHDAGGLVRAAAGEASFATLSPVFPSPDKGAPLGVERFRALVSDTSLPVYALGGIQAQHVPALKQAGAHGVAVISAVFAAPQPSAAVHALLEALASRTGVEYAATHGPARAP